MEQKTIIAFLSMLIILACKEVEKPEVVIQAEAPKKKRSRSRNKNKAKSMA